VSQTTPAGSTSSTGALTSLRIPELQAIAGQLGIKGTSKMRKSDLVSAISAAQTGGAKRSSRPAKSEAPAKAAKATEATASNNNDAKSSQQLNESTVRAERTERGERAERGERTERGERSGRNRTQRPARAEADATDAVVVGDFEIKLPSADGQERRRTERSDSGRPERSERSERSENGRNRNERNRNARNESQGESSGEQRRSERDGERNGSREGSREANTRENGQRENNRVSEHGDDGDDRNNRRRRGRDRYRDRDRDRDRKSRNRNRNELAFDDSEVPEGEALIPVAGVLDLLDNYAFVRTSGYLPGQNDVYVSLGQVKKAGLRRGDAITGAIRQPRESENQRQKFNALVRLDTVNGMSPEEARNRPDFNKLTPLYPQERLRLENAESSKLAPRLIDIVAPIGKGQRGLIVAPPKAGKTIIMQQIANAITANNPEVHLMVVLVDERPEEVTDMERTVAGEVIASTFDRPASDHTIVAELAIERAKRLVELGQDVVVLLDSITRLGRAYNLAAPASGRILSGGVDAAALYPPKKFFGAARNIENGGSLTILASALVETGSKMDEVIFEEFKGTGNMELRLSRQLADRRVFPAVDVNASGTRREEILVSPEELKITYKLRRVFSGLESGQALELMLKKLKENKTNVEFLLNIQKTTPDSISSFDED